MKKSGLVLAGIIALLMTQSTEAQYGKYDVWENNYTVQALLGAVQYENLKFDVPDATTPTEVDISLIPQFGAAWGTLPKGNRFQYGLECSFLMGVRFDSLNYLSAGGSGFYASLSTSMWMFDFAGGPYANLFVDKGRKVRIYAGAGPLMTYAAYRSETDYSEPGIPNDSLNESVFGIGVYARAGFEFRIYEAGMLGLGVRGTWSNVDFSEVGGSSELVGTAAFVSFTAGL
jgi:hypothetical protein